MHVSGWKMKRIVRRTARVLLALFGLMNIALYVAGGMNDHALAVTFAMTMMISATNFCTQCPLLASIRRLIQRKKKITVQRL